MNWETKSLLVMCYEVWVGKVNVIYFLESVSTSTVDINRQSVFFCFEFTLTVEIDPLFFTVDRIDHLNQPYFPVGESA